MVLRLTEEAKSQIIEMLNRKENEHYRLRFGVRGGGCSGLTYSLGFDPDYDQELDFLTDIDGVPVTIKKTYVNIISGTTIDFEQSMTGGGFTIDNPNAVNSCSCGSSSNPNERESVSGNCS